MMWEDIPAYEGLYQISRSGVVKRIKTRTRTYAGKLLKQHPDKDGYLRVALFKDGKAKSWKRATLVALTFLGPRPPGLQINHIDGDKTNDCPENLEYVTGRENILHSISLGLRHPARGEKSGRSKLSEDDVRYIFSRPLSATELAIEFDVTPMTIYRIWWQTNWGHITSATN